ncbi:MAG: D-alanyl-D-alanine carboxypeptidase family protein [Patescibacteria group bacterium]
MVLTSKDKIAIVSILEKIERRKRAGILVARLSLPALWQMLSKEERVLAQKIMRINPGHYGFRGPRYGITKVPSNLVVIHNQTYMIRKTRKTVSPQLVSKNVYNAYRTLNAAMRLDIGKTVLIESGYRSPAYQLAVFLHYLKHYKWNMRKTCKRVTLPGYSEHGYPPHQALDFITKHGVPSEKYRLRFEKTVEYKWLLKRAHRFNFSLSYPHNNQWGVMFEPWHWAYRAKP